ncbi:MAG: hypothetical protein ACREIB_06250, partial [Pseudomonadota bacterium]
MTNPLISTFPHINDQQARPSLAKQVGTALAQVIIPLGWALALAVPAASVAGKQAYEPLSASVQATLNRSISDQATPFLAFDTEVEARRWLAAMSKRLAARIADRLRREEFLISVHYEAKRAGLDPQ